MKTFLVGVLALAVSIGVVLFYTYADYGVALLVTTVFVGCAWLWRSDENDR